MIRKVSDLDFIASSLHYYYFVVRSILIFFKVTITMIKIESAIRFVET